MHNYIFLTDNMNIDCYKCENFYDEMFDYDNRIKNEYKQIYELLKDANDEDILINKKKLDKSFRARHYIYIKFHR